MRHTSRNRARLLLTVLSGGGGAAWEVEATIANDGDTLTFNEINSASAFTINWGDGNTSEITANRNTSISHTYTSAGTYDVTFSDGVLDVNVLDAGSIPIACDIAKLPPGASQYHFGFTSVTGDIAKLPPGASQYRFFSTAVTGDIAKLPPGANRYFFSGTSTTATGSPTTSTTLSSFTASNGYTQTEVDAIIDDLYAQRNVITSTPSINISYNNAAPSSAAITKINTLTAAPYNWTITYTAP